LSYRGASEPAEGDAIAAAAPVDNKAHDPKRGVAADDPFRGKFAERLVEEAQRQRPALDRSDLAGARDPDNDGLPHPKTLNLICLKI
jgi:hypothetical protein